MVRKLIRKIASEIKYDYYRLAGYELITGDRLFTYLFGKYNVGQYRALEKSISNKLDTMSDEGIRLLDQYIEILESKLKDEYHGYKVGIVVKAGSLEEKAIGFITPTYQEHVKEMKKKIDQMLRPTTKK